MIRAANVRLPSPDLMDLPEADRSVARWTTVPEASIYGRLRHHRREIPLERKGRGWAVINGESALGQVGRVLAMLTAMAKAKHVGIASVGSLSKTSNVGSAICHLPSEIQTSQRSLEVRFDG